MNIRLLLPLLFVIGIIITVLALYQQALYQQIDISEPDQQQIHFTFEYADDILSDPKFDTEKERADYKAFGLSSMEKLYGEFYKKFGFQPEHQIAVILSETVFGVKTVAYASKAWQYDGTITKLTIHFPYEFFENEWVRAHELTHSFIAPFFLPVFVDEGFAVYQENLYTEQPTHPILDLQDIRYDPDGKNAIQNWTEGQGIYADSELTNWCYRYSHSVIEHIEKTWPGTMAKVFETVHPHATLSSEAFITVLDHIIKDDMFAFFESIGFKL